MLNLENLIDNVIDNSLFTEGVLHAPKDKKGKFKKVSIRPLLIKGSLKYQFTYFDGKQTQDENLSVSETKATLLNLLKNEFKQGLISTIEAEYHILVSKKGKVTLLKKASTALIKKDLPLLEHNRKKKHLLSEGTPIPFLIELGIMTPQGKVIANKYDKFRQINRFVEMIDDILPNLDQSKTINIIDFGCGKSYLTFALYHYLTVTKELSINVIGLDLKSDVIDFCNALANKLNYTSLKFYVGDIEHYKASNPVDLVVSLHACDTATDAALEKAIKWKAKVILAVPCCQHELYDQMQNTQLSPMLKFGIIRERFAALATDALRAQILEVLGYKTQILEFIDMEHTPKNILIRAIRQEGKIDTKKNLQDFKQLKELLKVNPSLEQRFQDELK